MLRRSAVADFELVAAGCSYSVAQVAPEFIILEVSADISPGPAALFIRIEGRETRREIDLPSGASKNSPRVPIVRR